MFALSFFIYSHYFLPAGVNVFKNIGVGTRQLVSGVYELDMINAQQDIVTFTVWDFTGKG